MYIVTRQDHPKYGNVIQILRDENGTFQTPGMACNIAITARRLWREEGAKKVRYLIDDRTRNIRIYPSASCAMPSCTKTFLLTNCVARISSVRGFVPTGIIKNTWTKFLMKKRSIISEKRDTFIAQDI